MTASPLPPDPLASVEQDLAAAVDAPLSDRAEIFDRIHRGLAAALDTTALDTTALDTTPDKTILDQRAPNPPGGPR